MATTPQQLMNLLEEMHWYQEPRTPEGPAPDKARYMVLQAQLHDALLDVFGDEAGESAVSYKGRLYMPEIGQQVGRDGKFVTVISRVSDFGDALELLHLRAQVPDHEPGFVPLGSKAIKADTL
jgi:hypothetical protein